MAKKGLKIVLPSAVDNPEGLRKLDHYYGIEFTRGASDGGGPNGYHRMIGDESLMKELRFHNQMAIASVKDGDIQYLLNPTDWRKRADGQASVTDGSDGSDIMQVHTKTIYAILGGTDPTYERFIISDQPFSYDGDEAKEYPAWGESPDYVTLLNGQLRSIRNDGANGTQQGGSMENCSDPDLGKSAGGFPIARLSRYQFEGYARNLNESGGNLPYMTVCHQDLELTAAFMFIEFRTKNLNGLLGEGLSSNVVPTEQTWGKVSGLRMTSDGGASYQYKTFVNNIFTGADSTTASMLGNIVNSRSPMLKMFEAQLDISGGGGLESVKDSEGNPVAGKTEGVMTGIWTRKFTFEVDAAMTSGGEKKRWNVECVLRIPVWRGRTRLWGNCSQYYSGYECVRYLGEDGLVHHRLYRSPSVEALAVDTDEGVKGSLGGFAFEKAYEDCGELQAATGASNSACWGISMASGDSGTVSTGVAKENNAESTKLNYECASFVRDLSGSGMSRGEYHRCGLKFGGSSTEYTDVLRLADARKSPLDSFQNVSTGLRVSLKD